MSSFLLFAACAALSLHISIGFRLNKLAGATRVRNVEIKMAKNAFYPMPLMSIPEAAKSTLSSDLDAGMTADQVQSYDASIGGGLCGQSDTVKAAIGLGLNLGLSSLLVLIVVYALLSGVNWVLAKQVEDSLRRADRALLQAGQRSQIGELALLTGYWTTPTSLSGPAGPALDPSALQEAQEPQGNRAQRRMRSKKRKPEP
eukprot:gene40444-49292_t